MLREEFDVLDTSVGINKALKNNLELLFPNDFNNIFCNPFLFNISKDFKMVEEKSLMSAGLGVEHILIMLEGKVYYYNIFRYIENANGVRDMIKGSTTTPSVEVSDTAVIFNYGEEGVLTKEFLALPNFSVTDSETPIADVVNEILARFNNTVKLNESEASDVLTVLFSSIRKDPLYKVFLGCPKIMDTLDYIRSGSSIEVIVDHLWSVLAKQNSVDGVAASCSRFGQIVVYGGSQHNFYDVVGTDLW